MALNPTPTVPVTARHWAPQVYRPKPQPFPHFRVGNGGFGTDSHLFKRTSYTTSLALSSHVSQGG